MKLYSYVSGVLLVALLMPRPAISQQDRKVLLLNRKQSENRTCIARVSTMQCVDPAQREAFLNWRDGAQLHVLNRKFLTDYVVTVDTVFVPASPPIRGLNEIGALTLDSASELGPPRKGGVAALDRRSAGDFFLDLIDEFRRDAVREKFVADSAAIERDTRELQRSADLLLRRLRDLVGPTNPIRLCASTAGAPTLNGVQQCLREVDALLPLVRNALGEYVNEDAFRTVNTRAQDAASIFPSMQRRIDDVAPITALATLEAAILQFKLNRQTFAANLASLEAANSLYAFVKSSPTVFSQLRRAQLRSELLIKLKVGTPPQQSIDDAELNALISTYLDGKTPPPASRVVVMNGAAFDALFRADRDGIDRMLESIRGLVNVTIPDLVDGTNVEQSLLVSGINAAYDNSAVPETLIKPINLGNRSGNLLVYFTINRIENFQRYRIVPANSLAITRAGVGASLPSAASAASLPASGAATVTTTTTTSGAGTTGSTTTTESGPAPPPSNSASTVVAKGYFEMHSYDGGLVVAAFSRGSLMDKTFGVRRFVKLDTNGKETADSVHRITVTSKSSANHIMVAVGHYFQKRDTYPGAKNSVLAQTGALIGLSASKTNTFMLGAFWEPVIGLNLSAGGIYGRQQALENPLHENMEVGSDIQLPTYSKGALGYFLSAGLDLRIFSRVFGAITGLGVTSPESAGTP